jgi:hypothetical protein
MGIGITRILISDSRFVSRQDAMLTARQASRAALNAIVPELSMVADTGVVAATRDSFTIRVPVAFGIVCRAAGGGGRIVSFLPVDSVAWTTADTTGIYWRQRNGVYRRLYNISIAATSSSGDSSKCGQDSVRLLAGGRLIKASGLTDTPCSTSTTLNYTSIYDCQPDSLAVAMLYSRITYKFAPSSDLPGRTGLWRHTQNGSSEELVAPFDSSARFAYLMGGPRAATLTLRTSTVTGNGLDSIRGVELRLHGASEQAAQGTRVPEVFRLKTRVRFSNKVS